MNSDLPPAGGPNPASSPSGGAHASTPPPTPSRGFQDFFGRLRGLGVYRPDDGRWAAGVAAGLSRRSGVDPILIRGIFVALTFAGGLGVAAYGIAWLLLPQQDGRIHLQEAIHGRFTAGFVGAALLSLALFGDPGWSGDHWFAGPPRFLALFLLIGLIWWMHRHQDESLRYRPATSASGQPADDLPEYGSPEHRTASYAEPVTGPTLPVSVKDRPSTPAWTPPAVRPPDPAHASKRITRITLGLALVTAAAIGIIWQDSNSWAHPIALIAAAAALAVVAAGIITAGMTGRRSGGLAAVGILLTIPVLIGTAVHQAGVRFGQHTALIGDYTWQPVSVTAAERQYNLGVGQGELRLTDARLFAGATAADPVHVSARVGAGELIVVTPTDVPARVQVEIGAGHVVTADGTELTSTANNGDDSVSITRDVGPAGAPLLIVDVKQGAGEVQLRNADQAGAVTAGPAPTPSITKEK